MSVKKKTTAKKTAAAAVKAPAAKKAPAPKAAVKKAPVKKPAATEAAPAKRIVNLSAEERYQRIQFEAYLKAEKNGFAGDATAYWSEAEAIVDKQFA